MQFHIAMWCLVVKNGNFIATDLVVRAISIASDI